MRASPGLKWARRHALPTAAADAAWQFQDKLEHSQWESAAGHRTRQFHYLSQLVAHARAHVPYYAKALAGAGTRGLTEESWRQLPILSRNELQASHDALIARTYPHDHGGATHTASSGSTGRPVEVKGTELTQNWHRALTLRAMLWWTDGFDRKLASLRRYRRGLAEYPTGLVLDRWADELTLPTTTGPVASLGVHTPVHEQAEWLARVQPSLLITYPSNLMALCDVLQRRGERLQLKGIMTLGESLPDEARATARRVLGARIFDDYSANEIGYIALQCPQCDAYHVQSEALLVEVLDASGKPCGPGETGRVVLTPLHNYAMPLIRYEIGDEATVGGPCACGRGLPVLQRIEGRRRNMMVLPDGSRVWASLGVRGLRRIVPIDQLQFVQHTPSRLELRLVVARVVTADEEAAMRAYLRSRLPVAMEIGFTYLAEIPRGPGGKLESLISLIPPE
jgi:phenylacetate-CoA ligase